MWDAITAEASQESPLWAEAVRPAGEQERSPVFSPLGPPGQALGLETIYEGYLVHYGRSRLFSPADRDAALLLGDYLYAHGLVRVAETGDVAAVSDLAELISLCAQARAEGRPELSDAVWQAGIAAVGWGPSHELAEAKASTRAAAPGAAEALRAAARRAMGDTAPRR